jgi:hypothetical protein
LAAWPPLEKSWLPLTSAGLLVLMLLEAVAALVGSEDSKLAPLTPIKPAAATTSGKVSFLVFINTISFRIKNICRLTYYLSLTLGDA